MVSWTKYMCLLKLRYLFYNSKRVKKGRCLLEGHSDNVEPDTVPIRRLYDLDETFDRGQRSRQKDPDDVFEMASTGPSIGRDDCIGKTPMTRAGTALNAPSTRRFDRGPFSHRRDPDDKVQVTTTDLTSGRSIEVGDRIGESPMTKSKWPQQLEIGGPETSPKGWFNVRFALQKCLLLCPGPCV